MLSKISLFSVILPIILFVLFYKRNKGGGLWVIFLYCMCSFLADGFYNHFHNKPDYFFYIYSSFTITEYTLFTVFLYMVLKEKIFKYILIACSLLFYAIAILNIIHKNKESFDSISASLEAILIIVYGILFLYEQVKDPAIFYVYYSKKFWIIIAFLLYCSSTLFLFIYAATFTRPDQSTYWVINSVFDIIKNLLFAISFTMKKDKKQSYPMENLYADM